MSSLEHARVLMKKFQEAPGGHKAWFHVERENLAEGMQDRIDNPNSINQGQYGTCGPSAIVRDIVSDHPDEYVHMMTSLYWTGQCRIRHGRHAWGAPLMAGYDLRHYKPDDSVNAADWMLTSTLRDKLNDTFCREKFNGKLAVKGTSFDKQKALFQGMGYRKVHKHGSFLHHSSEDVMEEANTYLARHYHVHIGINATILHAHTQDDPPGHDHNHWVELLTPITIAVDDTVSFKVFSWGHADGIHVPRDPHPNKKLGLSLFERKFFGFVAARF